MSTTYEVERLDGPERGMRVSCSDHGESEEYRPGRKRVAFFCPDCGYELEVRLRDTHDWRPWGEQC